MVFILDENGEEVLNQEWYIQYTGYEIKELAEALFPWASVAVDREFYDEYTSAEEDWESALSRATDEDNGIIWEPPSSDAVYPYEAEISGEIDAYRLQLKLNRLGHAFLTLMDYLSETSR